MSSKITFNKFHIVAVVFFSSVLLLVIIKVMLFPSNLQSTLETKKLMIRNQTFTIELAQASKQRELGLSYRTSLGKYNGMLFSFETPGLYRFWMKEMNFPLDFLWIRDNKIVDLSESIPPPKSVNGQIMFVTPKEPVNAVVEINAGLIQELHIQKGDLITIK